MGHKRQTHEYVSNLKGELRKSFPDVPSSHLSEALAAGLGDTTHIGLLHRLDGFEQIPPQTLRYEDVKTRLWELGHEQHAPMGVRREYSYDVPCPDGSQGCWGTVERTVKGLPELDEEQLLEIRDSNSVTLTESYFSSTGVPVTREESRQLSEWGYITRQAYFDLDYCTCGSCGSDS